jgi:glycosyltransferase involved in cell wall biosynthesis
MDNSHDFSYSTRKDKRKFMKKDILIFSRYYLPGYKAGGPIESISLFVKKLKNYSNFSVFTSDRDFLDEFAYSNIKVNEWTERENTQIFYIDSNINSIFVYIKFLFSLKKFSTIYFTSLFDIKFTIIPIILIKFIYKDKKIIIAPRGELYDGALSIKKFKKVNFLFFSKLFNIFSDIIWHSTSSHESETIINNFDGAKLILAQNLIDDEISEIKRKFLNDKVKLVFFSRITEKKNLHYLLEILPHLNINYELDIFGPIDNIAYWHKCNSFIKKLNLEKRISYKGSIKKK